MNKIRLLVLSGSDRRGSVNAALAGYAAQVASDTGQTVSRLSLRELALPVYDGDLESDQGIPPGARKFQQAMSACDAVLLVSPEYNGFPPPLVINTFDWLSRVRADDGLGAGLATVAMKPLQ